MGRDRRKDATITPHHWSSVGPASNNVPSDAKPFSFLVPSEFFPVVKPSELSLEWTCQPLDVEAKASEDEHPESYVENEEHW